MTLSGRTAIVTGASQGLGRAIAEALLSAGASVLIVARDEARLGEATDSLSARRRGHQDVAAVVGDVADPACATECVDRARTLRGDLLVLVNNAGVYGPMGPIESVDPGAWVDAVRINLFGMMYFCRAVIPHQRARRAGKIINLSGGGATAPLPRLSAYAASKAAVVRLTETLAVELKDAGVDVNAIAPGALNTRLLDQVVAAGPDVVGEEFHAKAVRQRSEGGALLSEGAALAVFLASAASDGITGRLLSAVWDDWRSLAEHRAMIEPTDVFTLRRITPADRGVQW